MPSRRVIDWQIRPNDDDTYDLLLRHRPVLIGSSMTEIGKYLRRHRQPGQSVHQVAEDGYITDITRAVERRQPARRTPPARRRHRPVRMPLMRF